MDRTFRSRLLEAAALNGKLDPKQLATLKATLSEQDAMLRKTVREHLLNADDDQARLLADRVGDAEDASVTEVLLDLDFAAIDRDVRELRDVAAALQRMQLRTYGVCTQCGGEIPFDRLLAYPTAKRCLDCQRVHEKTFAGKGTPSL
jgi:DnaK suppressor protein